MVEVRAAEAEATQTLKAQVRGAVVGAGFAGSWVSYESLRIGVFSFQEAVSCMKLKLK